MQNHGTCHAIASFESTRSFEADGATGLALPAHTGHVPSRYPQTSSETERFTSGLRGGLFETRSHFYHTLRGPCDVTVPRKFGIVRFSENFNGCIMHATEVLSVTWWQGMPLPRLCKA
jgi:hypothetical protein